MSTYICKDVAELQRRAFFEFVAIDCRDQNKGEDVWNVRGPGNYDRLCTKAVASWLVVELNQAMELGRKAGAAKIRAGDTVWHRPSREKWAVAAVSPDGTELVCCGWPESVAKVADCTLVNACSDAEHAAMLDEVVKSCGDQLRGSWARQERERSKGGAA